MGNRLYVGNLSFNADTETVRETFAGVGDVTDVHVVMDRDTGRSRGFAFVTMGTAQLAAEAISRLNGATVDGRALRVNEAEERGSAGGRRNERSGGNRR
jgi:RNA recognition motif-containing protein